MATLPLWPISSSRGAWGDRAREGLSSVGLACGQGAVTTPPDQQTRHPKSGTSRALYDCLDIALTPKGPVVRCSWRPVRTGFPSFIGTLRNGMVYQQFFTTVPPQAFTPADVLDLYLHRGSFETVLADEDPEQEPDRWVLTRRGGRIWQILSQWGLEPALGVRAARVSFHHACDTIHLLSDKPGTSDRCGG